MDAEDAEVVGRAIDEPGPRRQPADPLDQKKRGGALEDDEVRFAQPLLERAERRPRVPPEPCSSRAGWRDRTQVSGMHRVMST